MAALRNLPSCLGLTALALGAMPLSIYAQTDTMSPGGIVAPSKGQVFGIEDSLGSADDPYLRMPDARGADDPLLRRVRRTSRSIEGGNRAIAVMDRKRPFYDPVGLPVGTFNFYPSVTTTANGISNVFSQSNESADAFLTLRGDALLKSDWSRHMLLLRGFVAKDLHAKYTTENNFNYRMQFAGRLDLDDSSNLLLQGVHERVTLDRGGTGDILASRRPTYYRRNGIDSTAKIGGRGRMVGKIVLGYDERIYADGENLDKSRLDLSFRDYKDYKFGGQLGYKIGPTATFFVSASRTWRRFDISRYGSRNVDVTEALAGMEGDVTPVIRGRFGVGYLRANFISSEFKTTSGLALDAQLEFMVTELTTINVSAQRELRNVAGINANAAMATFARLSADHEFLRNLIITPSISYEKSNYVDSNRKANMISADASVRWLISPRFRATFTTGFRKRNASNFDVDRDFSAFNASAGVTFQF
jgi:hypothetical protein